MTARNLEKLEIGEGSLDESRIDAALHEGRVAQDFAVEFCGGLDAINPQFVHARFMLAIASARVG